MRPLSSASKRSGIYVRVHHSPLARPVRTHSFVSVNPAALHPIGPLHLRMQHIENGVNVATVEGVVNEDQQIAIFGNILRGGRHPCTDSKNGCSNASAIQRRKRAASAPSISRWSYESESGKTCRGSNFPLIQTGSMLERDRPRIATSG